MTVTMRRRLQRGVGDRGAAAVEFALVLLPLMLLVTGILDYGRFFFDSVSLRQGAREGARQAVVQLYGGNVAGSATLCSSLGTAVNVGARIACTVKAATDSTIGTPTVYIPSVTWAQGGQLLVCMESKEQGTGFVPLPASGILRTKTYMSIEVGSPVVDPSYSADTAPSGSAWTSWCS